MIWSITVGAYYFLKLNHSDGRTGPLPAEHSTEHTFPFPPWGFVRSAGPPWGSTASEAS